MEAHNDGRERKALGTHLANGRTSQGLCRYCCGGSGHTVLASQTPANDSEVSV